MDYLRRFHVTLIILFLFLSPIEVALSQPKNIILFIGDGMGFEQVKAASMYANGVEGTLSFETFPYQAELITYSADSSIADSAASSTAMATGFKVNNGVISILYPGDGSELETLLEFFRDSGKSTGLVTTTYITHATPAAFGAHEPSRYNYTEIASDYLNQTLPNVLFGGGGYGMTVTSAEQAGYTVVSDREEMLSLDTESITMVSGQFGDTNLPYEYDGIGPLPHLSEMTSTALHVLDNNPNGLFLMVEGGRIDHAGYSNDIIRNILETIEFSNAVSVSMDWAEGRTDTLIIVTADHETGGLTVLQNNGQGNIPTVSWSTASHTEKKVPIYAWGEKAELVSGLMDNTDIFYMATNTTVFDADGDGMADDWEINYFGNLTRDGDEDYDSDMLTDFEEYQNGTNPSLDDTDGDGMLDGWEDSYGLDPLVDDADEDPDEDGLSNYDEYDYDTDPFKFDSDEDLLSDSDEVYIYGTDPNDPDIDGDGMLDGFEIIYFGNISRDGTGDYDNDGLTDLDEYRNGTDPTKADTDGDNYSDYYGSSSSGGGGGCFIATAAFGSPMERHVKILRDFRDKFLLNNSIGKAFVDFYYAYSPPIAEIIIDHAVLRFAVRWSLIPIVGLSWIILNFRPIISLMIILLLFFSVVGLIRFRRKLEKSQ